MSATGNVENQGILSRLIAQLPPSLTRAATSRLHWNTNSAPAKERLACLPPERAVLNVRPYAKVSGPRKVPILASANGVPFLRLTKPQPPALSRILRQRLDFKIKTFDARVLLFNWWLPMCENEDKWDELISARFNRREDNVSWTESVNTALRLNQNAYTKDVAKDRSLIRKMQQIVDQETKLALQEGQTIVRGRKRRPIRVIKPQSV